MLKSTYAYMIETECGIIKKSILIKPVKNHDISNIAYTKQIR